MIPTTERLRQVFIFSSLEDKHLSEISAIAGEKSFEKNEVIFTQGDPGSVLFILLSGTVKVSLIDAYGKETTLKMLYENDFFGEMSLLDGHFRSATVTALEPTKALTIFREDFIRLIQKNPLTVLNIVTVLCGRLRKADEQIGSLTFLDSFGKVAHTLLDLASQEGERKNGSIVLNLRFTRQELANMAAVSRETLTRILYEFQARGCLKVEGKKIVILDEGLLRQEMEEKK